MTDTVTGVTAAAMPGHVALTAAADLASRLVAEAVWSGGRCTWVGAEPLERLDARRASTGAGRLTYRALGPDLYSGTSGVALFLAELAAATGREDVRRTALGAVRHALSRTDDIEPHVRRGYYVGWSGIGCAALRAGSVLDRPELVEHGHALLLDAGTSGADTGTPAGARVSLAAPVAAEEEYDLIAGGAGAVLGQLEGWRRTGDSQLLDGAVRMCEDLVRTARRRAVGWSWRSPDQGDGEDLTGLSHGAAGVALALVEAYRATGDRSLAEAAREAMRYEDHWFDADRGNWPDFRPDLDEMRSSHRPTAFKTLWCHGAPGIALARLHAHRYLGDAAWLDDAAAALRTTVRATNAMLGSTASNFSLCHGLAGNAECLREPTPKLVPPLGTADLAARVAWHGIERHASGGPWPCGTHTEETPNLMLGLAGIGLFYLRLAEPSIPSVLMPVAP